MPRKVTKRKPFGKKAKKYRKKFASKRTANSLICKSLNVFPNSYTCNLSYRGSLSMTTVSTFDNQFRLNSVFDPEYTAAGGQPRYFDQLAGLYGKYRVNCCSMLVTMTNLGASPVLLCMAAANTTSVFDILTAEETPFRSRVLNLGGNGALSTGKLYKKFFPRMICGANKTQYKSDDVYSSVITTNPVENIILNVVAEASDHTAALLCCYDFQLIYNTTFFDRILVGPS